MDHEGRVADALREQVKPTAVDALLGIDDLPERARETLAAIDEAADLRDALVRLRRNTLVEMNQAGMSWAAIGAELGMSGTRAWQIVNGRTR